MPSFSSHLNLESASIAAVAKALAASGQSPLVLWSNGTAEETADAGTGHRPGEHTFLFAGAASTFSSRSGVPRSEVTRSEVTRSEVTRSEALRSAVVPDQSKTHEQPFPALERWLASALPPDRIAPAALAGAPAAFVHGAIGFIAYDAAQSLERIRGMTYHSLEPEMLFFVPKHRIVFTRSTGEIIIVSSAPGDSGLAKAHCALVETISRALTAARPPTACAAAAPWIAAREEEDFVRRVERAIEYIRAGDAFQIVLSNRFSTPKEVDPFAAYERLEQNNPSPFHFLFQWDQHTIVGASPEVMLRANPLDTPDKIRISMRPVAGTYPKGTPHANDALRHDRKEQAEHLMLVDHARNDIGRVSLIGSVEVGDLFAVESYASVHHLVSEVSGTLRPERTLVDALASCFPIATLTGTPKIRAMEIIAELEESPRGIFGGALMALDPAGSVESAVAIRFLRTGPDGTEIRAGAGIVADSDPHREFLECFWKADPIARAAGWPLQLPGRGSARPGES